MATKNEEFDNPGSCFNKAHPNEPLFVLRAQDRIAPEVVRYWAHLASGGAPAEYIMPAHLSVKSDEALAAAARMEEWPTRKMPD